MLERSCKRNSRATWRKHKFKRSGILIRYMSEMQVNYPRINAGASCFTEGSCCTASPQASIRAVPALLHNVLVLWVSAKPLSNVLTILELVLLSNHDLLKPHTNCQRAI
jgi:hypothetical protein